MEPLANSGFWRESPGVDENGSPPRSLVARFRLPAFSFQHRLITAKAVIDDRCDAPVNAGRRGSITELRPQWENLFLVFVE